ncbi:hypothetical protein Aperf_G00000001599 [Anoplocephala perfoliata]
MLPALVVRSFRRLSLTPIRRVSSKMPDPYRESYSPFKDPVPILGFFLVVTPLAWMLYDIVKYTSGPRERQGGPAFTFKRGASSKRFPREGYYALAFGIGVVGFITALNGFLYLREHRYADPTYYPVYEKRPVVKPATEPALTAPAESEPADETSTPPPAEIKLPSHMKYVIVGAGASGMSAARAIRSADPLSKILLIAGDSSCGEELIEAFEEDADTTTTMTYPPPYVRPVLSGGLWWRSPERRKIMLNPSGDIRTHSWFFYEPLSFFIEPQELVEASEGGICLLRGNPVVSVHPDRHAVSLADGQEVKYDCCLLATGVQPIRIPELEHCSLSGVDLVSKKRITYFRNIGDYKHLQSVSDRLHRTGGRVAVLGNGPLACEIAASLLEDRRLSEEEKLMDSSQDPPEFHVHQFLNIAVAHPMVETLPPVLAEILSNHETERGIHLEANQSVVRASLVDPNKPTDSKICLTVAKRDANGFVTHDHELIVDHVVCALGTVPRTDLAISAGLEVDPRNGGLLVNGEMESRQDIYAAGSAASFWDSQLKSRRRIDHISVSEDTGELAGLNMARSANYSNPEEKAKLDEIKNSDDYDPLPLARKFQSDIWFNMSKDARYDSVGLIDSVNLLTRTVFLEGSDRSAVVFYIQPDDHRLVGVLLWNLNDELFDDSEYAPPTRLNLARKMLADNLILTDDASILKCAQQFDLPGEIAESYAELKTLMKAKQEEEQTKELDDAASKPSANPTATEESKVVSPVVDISGAKVDANLGEGRTPAEVEEKPLKMKINSWFGVATWRWCTNDSTCGICRNAFEACCPDCKLPGDDCSIIQGTCTHFFHMHCIFNWLHARQNSPTCPLCRQEWKFVE